MRSRIVPVLVVGMLSAASACAPEVACTEVAVAGAVVTVLDETAAHVCDAVVVLIDAAGAQEQLEANSQDATCSYAGAYENAGVYDVDVAKDGYRRALLGDALRVNASEDGCHVVPEKVTVTLEVEAP